MSKIIQARALKVGDVILLPMGRTATIKDDPKIGRIYVHTRTEHGPSRFTLYQEVQIQGPPVCSFCGGPSPCPLTPEEMR